MTKKPPAGLSASAFVFSTRSLPCPVCGLTIPSSTFHRCGDMSSDETAPFEAVAAAFLGHKGGKVKSPAKTRAVRENGKKGGRPKDLKP